MKIRSEHVFNKDLYEEVSLNTGYEDYIKKDMFKNIGAELEKNFTVNKTVDEERNEVKLNILLHAYSDEKINYIMATLKRMYQQTGNKDFKQIFDLLTD